MEGILGYLGTFKENLGNVEVALLPASQRGLPVGFLLSHLPAEAFRQRRLLPAARVYCGGGWPLWQGVRLVGWKQEAQPPRVQCVEGLLCECAKVAPKVP